MRIGPGLIHEDAYGTADDVTLEDEEIESADHWECCEP